MELRVLQYFLTVVQEENISRAAEVLHVTQPTLSRQMAQLEEELGVQLFVRGRHLTLTDAGVMLRRRAEEVTALMEKMQQELEGHTDVGGVISIGSGGLMALQALSPAMAAFREQHPKVQYQLYTNHAEHVKERLEQGLLDFGLLLEPVDVSKFDYLRMGARETWGLLMRSDHPLARKPHIVREDLIPLPLITSDRRSIQRELETWLGMAFSRLNLFATYNIITNVATLVHEGVAVALTIEGAVSLLEGDRLVFRPLYPELSMTSVLAWKKFPAHSRAAGQFLEQVKRMQISYSFP